MDCHIVIVVLIVVTSVSYCEYLYLSYSSIITQENLFLLSFMIEANNFKRISQDWVKSQLEC